MNLERKTYKGHCSLNMWFFKCSGSSIGADPAKLYRGYGEKTGQQNSTQEGGDSEGECPSRHTKLSKANMEPEKAALARDCHKKRVLQGGGFKPAFGAEWNLHLFSS